MNLLKIDAQIKSFRDKIIKTFKLQIIDDSNFIKEKTLCKWITEQSLKLKKINKEDQNQKGFNKLFAGVMQKIMKGDQSSKQFLEKDLKTLSQCIRKKIIPKTFNFQSKNIPVEIVNLVNELKDRKWSDFYGEVHGPLLDSMVIMRKQDFHTNVQLVKVNGLKIMMIQEKVAHRYQRNLIQQIFGRVFRSQGSLSTVIKIQVNTAPLEPNFNIFCYIQDRQLIDQDNSNKSLADLQINNNKLQIDNTGQILQVNQINMLQIFLAQILVLPVQSLVSDFVIKISKNDQQNRVQVIKCNQQDQQQIVKQTSLRQHSSLRNPLLYFSAYIREHPIHISKAKQISIKAQLYACFYRSLEIVIKLMLSDFQTYTEDIKINSSICFNIEVFQSLWIIFHKICLLSSWMNQVIQPVKKVITIGQIITHFCPIFNQISKSSNIAQNFTAYKQFYNNVEMESYLGSIVSKKALQKYKDIFLNQNQVILNKKYDNSVDIYNQIFSPILQQTSLEYLDPIQSSFILFFYCKYKFQYQPFEQQFQQKWRSHSLWTKCTKCLLQLSHSKSGDLPFIDIGFDFLAFACDINVYMIDNKCFERVKNFEENQKSIQGISKFVDFINKKHEKMADMILSSLLQKSLKHKKFKVSRKLLQKRVRIRNFNQIIAFHQIIDQMDEQSRQILVKAIQQRSPQMHRLFKWQELMLVNLQKQCKESIQIQTVDFGTIFLPVQILKTNIKNGRVMNNVSRKDYRFNSSRQIAHFSYKCGNGKTVSFYIEGSQYPLMQYFYRCFLKSINIPEIMPYFTSFFYENKLFHLVQCIQESLNYSKGLTNFKQQQLNQLTDQALISEAILISMILLPSQIQLKDIIICPTKADQDQIFLVDWHSYYCKDFMHKQSGKVTLNCKNILFLLQNMNKSINKKIINKFSWIQIQKIGQSVMQQCMLINKKVNQMRNLHCKEQDFSNQKQLLALIFQEGFLFAITERMYKIKRAFTKKQNVQKGISFMKVLQLLNSSTCFYYEQVFNQKQTLLQREKILFNENSKRPFLQSNLVQFFGAFQRLQEKDNIFPLHYDRFCFEGPTQNLISVGTNMKKFLAFKSSQIPPNLADFPNDFFQYYMRYCDLTGTQTQKKEKLIQIIKLKSRQHIDSKEKRVLPLSYISIKSMQFIKQKNLANSFSFQRVQQLLIQSCKLGEHQLNYFPKTIQNILYLHLNGISGLKYIGENVLYGKAIQIRHLKTLSIIQCNDLVSIDIKCDILENLQLRNNKNLEVIHVFSLNLKNIYIYNMPSLFIQNIGIYIIKGINVLGCNSSCHGDLIKLYAQDYETYTSYVIRYLLFKFFQSNDSRYWMIFTLLKLKEVDQSLYTIAGFSNLKAVSVVFKDFSIDIQDKILVELIRLYIGNPYRRRVCINDLIQNSISTNNFNIQRLLRLINQAIAKTNTSKSITQIKFDNTKLFFNNINNQSIKKMVDKLYLDKNVTILFENLKQQAQGTDAQDKKTISRETDTIRYISVQKPQIQKITLIFKNSIIQETMLQNIFKDTKSISQIVKSQSTGSSVLKSGFSSVRQSLREQNCNYMKINNIVLDGCTLVHDKGVNLMVLQSQLKSASKQMSEKKIVQLSQIQLESICKSDIHYSSVKSLKISNCMLQEFQFLNNFQNLTHLSISKCNIQIPNKKQNKVDDFNVVMPQYSRLFKILTTLPISCLEFQNFFTLSNSSMHESILFRQFCQALKNIKKLKQLKLNKNYFTFQNLKVFEKNLNDTQIQQIQLYEMSFENQQIHSMIQQQSIVNKFQVFRTLFQKCHNLKSLTIQINNIYALQQFIKSISQNQHLIQLKLHSSYQISSTMLNPLNQNKKLSLMSSNQQLPVWLINHIRENAMNIRKSKIIQFEDDTDGKDDPMNTTINFGTLNSIRANNDFFKIGLSLDGGGVRGMLLATQLNYLADRVGYPLHKIFDCIGGTSIGGILALASSGTLDGYNPVADTQQLMQLFSKYGRDIFKKTQIMQLKSLFDTKYSANSFEGVLKNYFKDCKLSNCLTQTNVIVTAVNRVDNKDYIFRSMDALLNRDRDFYMRDVARATSAAPTYFPSAEIKNINASIKLSLVDGGVGLNNPSKLVIDQVKKISANSGLAENYFLLSLGTGKLPSQVIPQFAGLKDLSPIIDSFTESAAYFVERDLATNYKGHFFRVSPLINVKVKKDAELDNTSEQIIEMYRETGLEAAKKYFQNTVIFGKYRNLSLIQWLKQNTARKFDY